MCGIIGYTGYRQASQVAYEALLRLEYRGYDSVGIAIAGENTIEVRKDIGKVAEVNDKVNFKEMKGTTGIGHTRWATHGGVTKDNAHPHVSNNGEIMVIHNGIVENYQELKQQLQAEGFKFYSETDTETIPNLIEYEMRQGKTFQQATMDTVKQLHGYYAVLAMHSGEKKIIGTRNGSPLVIGLAEDENFIASDIPAFLEYTKQVQYISDHDFVVLDGDPLSIYTKVLQTYVEGDVVFDRSDPQDYLYAVGGYGAGHDQQPYYCCFDQSQQGGAQ